MTTTRFRWAAATFVCLLWLPAMAQDAAQDASRGTTPAASTEAAPAPTAETRPMAPEPTPAVTLELNLLEPIDAGCRATFIVGNPMLEALSEMQLDTFFFGPDEIVRQRLALTFDNVRAERRKVVPFDLSLACEEIGTVLVNEVLVCEAASGPVPGCVEGLEVSTRTPAALRY